MWPDAVGVEQVENGDGSHGHVDLENFADFESASPARAGPPPPVSKLTQEDQRLIQDRHLSVVRLGYLQAI